MALPNSNDVLYGTDLVLLVDVSATQDGTEFQQIAHATSHSIDISRDSRSIASKSSGEWDNKAYGKISWSGSCDGLVIFDSAVFNYEQLADLQIERKLVKVISVNNDFITNMLPLDDTVADYDPLSTVAANNPFVAGTPYYEGDAIITSLGISAGEGDNATFTMSFEGGSALVKKTVATVV